MSIGKNIRELRRAKRMTILELANQVGSDIGNISRIETGVRGHFSEDMLRAIASALNVTPAALFAPEANAEKPDISGRIPLISWAAAYNVSATHPIENTEEWLVCPVEHGMRTYALRVRDDSMHNPDGKPSFTNGEIIFVDPDRNAEHTSLVIACPDGENKATFKRLLIMIDGKTKMLEALNPEWPNRIFQINNGARICGTVIARIESFV